MCPDWADVTLKVVHESPSPSHLDHGLGVLELGLGNYQTAYQMLQRAASGRSQPDIVLVAPDLLEASVRCGRTLAGTCCTANGCAAADAAGMPVNDSAPPRTSSPRPAPPSPSAPVPSWPPPARPRENGPSRPGTTSHLGSGRSPGLSLRARRTRKPPPGYTSARRPSTTTSAACSGNSASNPAGSCSAAHPRMPEPRWPTASLGSATFTGCEGRPARRTVTPWRSNGDGTYQHDDAGQV